MGNDTGGDTSSETIHMSGLNSRSLHSIASCSRLGTNSGNEETKLMQKNHSNVHIKHVRLPNVESSGPDSPI